MRVTWPAILVSLIVVTAVGCSQDHAPNPTGATTATEQVSGGGQSPTGAGDPNCQFARGVTACTTTSQHVEPGTHSEVSGCMAFNGTVFVAGRRTRTFNDQTQITDTTVTRQHGRNGKIFDTSTTTTRTLLTSTLVSDTCVPI